MEKMSRILLVSPIDPQNHSTGESDRIGHIIGELKIDGFHCDLIHGDGSDSDRPLGFSNSITRYLFDLNPFLYLQLLIQLRNHNYSAIQVEEPHGVVAAKIATLITRNRSSTVVLDSHNFESGLVKRQRSNDIHWVKRTFAPYIITLFEQLSVSVANHVLTVSESDKAKFRDAYGLSEDDITVIPSGSERIEQGNIDDTIDARKEYDLSLNDIIVVFHGTYSYKPNEEAVSVIKEVIAPRFSDEDIQFVIAGNGAPESATENVRSIGFVDDLYSFLNACDIAVVPLKTGGGTKLKMFDYMACSLPVVTTTIGAEGIQLTHNESAMITDDISQDMVEFVDELADNEEKRDRLAREANELFEDEYTWDSIGERLRDFYSQMRE